MTDNIKYSSDQISVPLDYGTARCINCGGELNTLYQCKDCHAQFDSAEACFQSTFSRLNPVSPRSDVDGEKLAD